MLFFFSSWYERLLGRSELNLFVGIEIEQFIKHRKSVHLRMSRHTRVNWDRMTISRD